MFFGLYCNHNLGLSKLTVIELNEGDVELYELHRLNSALDGKPLPFLAAPATLTMTSESSKAVLDDTGSPTEEGRRLMALLWLYKTADKHVKIGGARLGLVSDEKCIAILYSMRNGTYRIEIADTAYAARQIFETYPFLNESRSPQGMLSERMGLVDFLVWLTEHAVDHLRVTTSRAADGLFTDEFLFLDGGILHRYDCVTETKHSITLPTALTAIESRLRLP